MRFGTHNLRRFAGALVCGVALLCGTGAVAYGQHGHEQRKAEKRELKEHQKFEKREFKADRREDRQLYGNSRELRERERARHAALQLHQRQERIAFKQRYQRNRGHHYGRNGITPGQRFYTGRRIYRSRFNR
jgi:uncharacterized protein HemX